MAGCSRWVNRAVALAALIAAGVGVPGAEAAGSLPQAAAEARLTADHVCAACHGADGNSPRGDVPSLAEQSPDYLYDQLQQFAAQGHRRASGVMGAIAVNLSAEQMRALAEYFSYQRLLPAPMPLEQRPTSRGAAIYRNGIARHDVPACASCHGEWGRGLGSSFPRLAGQHAPYIASQLRDFRDGRRASDPHASMRTISSRLSDADIQAVADYVAAIR